MYLIEPMHVLQYIHGCVLEYISSKAIKLLPFWRHVSIFSDLIIWTFIDIGQAHSGLDFLFGDCETKTVKTD